MRIAVYKTEHEIADTVAEAVYEGLSASKENECNCFRITERSEVFHCDIGIAYGILRGTDVIYKSFRTVNKPFFIIDRGYFKPGHFDGFYRVSLNGTQQTTGLDKLKPDYERWEQLGLEVLPAREIPKRSFFENGRHLVCPPTLPVAEFFGIDIPYWNTKNAGNTWNYEYRPKGMQEPLKWDRYDSVITFNSGIAWEALRQGIPCISDENHSFVGAYQKQFDISPHLDVDSRRRMFAVQAGLQLRLDEIRSGLLWPLIQKLLSTSGMTAERQSLPMSSLQV